MLTAERARELLDYDPETGIMRWRVTRNNRVRATQIAGRVEAQGYRVIKIDGKTYKAHRVGWLIVHGQWPRDELDHEQGERADIRLSAVREATHAENSRNRKRRVDNSSGVMGIHRRPDGKWQARININGRRVSLGHFVEFEDAAKARAAALLAAGYHPNHGRG